MSTQETPHDQLWRLASLQRGYFTAAQAVECGYSHQAQHFHKQSGNWIAIDRGIYRFREFQYLPDQETDHFVRWSLWSRGRAVVSHTSALSVHDLGIANPEKIHLTVPPDFRKKNSAIVLHHGRIADKDIEEHEGFRVTTPLRAVLETAEAGTDQDIVHSAVTELLSLGLVTRQRLVNSAQELGPRAELGVQRALESEGI